jgi:hypothetical protein
MCNDILKKLQDKGVSTTSNSIAVLWQQVEKSMHTGYGLLLLVPSWDPLKMRYAAMHIVMLPITVRAPWRATSTYNYFVRKTSAQKERTWVKQLCWALLLPYLLFRDNDSRTTSYHIFCRKLDVHKYLSKELMQIVSGVYVSALLLRKQTFGNSRVCRAQNDTQCFDFRETISYLKRLWIVEEMPCARAHCSTEKWNLLDRNADMWVNKHMDCHKEFKNLQSEFTVQIVRVPEEKCQPFSHES